MLDILCWQDWLNADSQRNHIRNTYYIYFDNIYIYAYKNKGE